jgi:hypothetical protein
MMIFNLRGYLVNHVLAVPTRRRRMPFRTSARHRLPLQRSDGARTQGSPTAALFRKIECAGSNALQRMKFRSTLLFCRTGELTA